MKEYVKEVFTGKCANFFKNTPTKNVGSSTPKILNTIEKVAIDSKSVNNNPSK